MDTYLLQPGQISFNDIKQLLQSPHKIELNDDAYSTINASHQIITNKVQQGQIIYGVNTGFGALANTIVDVDKIQDTQHRLVLSHCTGCGPLLSDEVVGLILLLKVNCLAQGYSGARQELIDALRALYNEQVYPLVPSKGSVGASGDLAPLSHLSCAILGVGDVRIDGVHKPAVKGLKKAGLKPLSLSVKEGLALINGTQASTALATMGLVATEQCYHGAVISGALTLLALKGSAKSYQENIQRIRGHQGQIDVAQFIYELVKHNQDFSDGLPRVQDPYCLRCVPQVMGACLDQIRFAANTILTEVNGVTDNPLVFSDDDDVVSGGNFHGEPVAMAADNLAIAIAEVGSIVERRLALLMDQHMSGLPPFLVNQAGFNSGFMNAQVTAAALVSENKSLAHPASVDSIPTSANQEDHVSMSTFAARRLLDMTDNCLTVVAIELLAACQAVELAGITIHSDPLNQIMLQIRQVVPSLHEDRYMASDIQAIKHMLTEGQLAIEGLDIC